MHAHSDVACGRISRNGHHAAFLSVNSVWFIKECTRTDVQMYVKYKRKYIWAREIKILKIVNEINQSLTWNKRREAVDDMKSFKHTYEQKALKEKLYG